MERSGGGDHQFFRLYKNHCKQRKKGHIRIYSSLPDEYTVYGEDALFFQREFRGIIAKEWKYEQETIPYVNMRQNQFQTFLCDLFIKYHYIVELWEKDDGWLCTKRGSPGNAQDFDEILLQSSDFTQSLTVSIRVTMVDHQPVIGLCAIDTLKYQLYVTQFIDNDRFTGLESVFIQLGAQECVYEKSTQEIVNSNIQQVLNKDGMMVTVVNKDSSDPSLVDRILSQSYDKISVYPEALFCCANLIEHLSLLDDPCNFKAYTIIQYNPSEFMRMDGTSIVSLNIFPQEKSEEKNFSLIGLIDQCCTRFGSRILKAWIRQPLKNEKEINNRLDIVSALADEPYLMSTLRQQYLKYFPDLDAILRRLQRKRCTLKDLHDLFLSVRRISEINKVLDDYKGEFANSISVQFLEPMKRIFSELSDFSEIMDNALDFDLIPQKIFQLNPECDDVLYESFVAQENCIVELKKIGEAFCRKHNIDFKMVKMETSKSKYTPFCMTTTKGKTKNIEKKVRILETKKTGTFFTIPKFEEVSQKLEGKEIEFQVRQKELILKLTEGILIFIPSFQELKDCLTRLDILTNFAYISVQHNYMRPKILEKETNILQLKSCRHPMVEYFQSYISNDVNISQSERFILVFGPNMGGKSCYIRSIAISVLMAQVGCFVPCDSATISVRDSILCRIGANDMQYQGVSTFMAEMLETSSIIQNATPYSLIIVDELGRGTSTKDGFGLAYAISEYIVKNLQCMCLFATHFHELAMLQDQMEGIKNVNVVVQSNLLTDEIIMLYKVKDGSSDKSFGIDCARLAKFPDNVIDVARTKSQQLKRTRQFTSEEPVLKRSKNLDEIGVFLKRFSRAKTQTELSSLRQEICD